MAYFFIIAAVILRLVPHPANFAPIAAMALFGGVYLNKKYAFGVPMLALFCSDYFIGFYNPWIMFSVYGCFLIIGFLGTLLKQRKNVLMVFGATFLGSTIFFLITNFAVWAIPGSMYAHSWQGLMQSYIMGLPFFKNTLLGDFFYVGAMFGLMEAAILITKNWRLKKERYEFVFKRISRERF